MENQIKIIPFSSGEFGELKTIIINGENWFVGKHIASVLGYKRTNEAIREHCDDATEISSLQALQNTVNEDIQKLTGNFTNSVGKTKLITESDLYSLIISSKLPSAKAFKRWVTKEVLPSLRKHGVYAVGQENLAQDKFLELMNEMQKTMNNMEQKIEDQNRAYSLSLDNLGFGNRAAVTSSKKDPAIKGVSMERFCDLISETIQTNIGPNKVFTYLRDSGYLIGTLADNEFCNPDEPNKWFFNNINKFEAPKRLHVTELGVNMLREQIVRNLKSGRQDLLYSIQMAPQYKI